MNMNREYTYCPTEEVQFTYVKDLLNSALQIAAGSIGMAVIFTIMLLLS